MEYKILRTISEETAKGNDGLERLARDVNEHILQGWKPLGGVAACPVVGPASQGTTRDNWFTCFAQAVIKE
jgi:hypothetical protein